MRTVFALIVVATSFLLVSVLLLIAHQVVAGAVCGVAACVSFVGGAVFAARTDPATRAREVDRSTTVLETLGAGLAAASGGWRRRRRR